MNWRTWGPYLSERQWGTVREDYSEDGNAWAYFPFEMAASRAYRWGEDGIGGISDDKQILCFSFAFWNEKDPILKERFYGLSNEQGNHGEDVKELYYYLDNTPDHSYMKMLYKYPQRAFPYEQLKNLGRNEKEPELELIDTGVFDENRYFDLVLEYAKEDPENILIRCTALNRGPSPAPLHILPTLWFRNTWIWKKEKPQGSIETKNGYLLIEHPALGTRYLYFDGTPDPLFTNNETNSAKLFQSKNSSPYTKDAFHEAIVHGNQKALNPGLQGTKAALHYKNPAQIRLRFSSRPLENPFADFDALFEKRLKEADAFYDQVCVSDPAKKSVQRQAWSGLLWSKQFYHYVVEEWLSGDDPDQKPPDNRLRIRNARWRHFYSEAILLMPDKWEYPWFAAWDTAFHTVSLAYIDPEFAKEQLLILFKDVFMHPSGQIPAYEWDFENINPPVLSWAALQIYRIEEAHTGKADREFLGKIFHQLQISFTWWLNRKDLDEKGVFEGGFLGMDNISLFNRSAKLPPGYRLIQSDATSWMAMYCLHMARMALELSDEEQGEKFFSVFLFIGEALNELWDEEEGFYFDKIELPEGNSARIKIHSYVGLIPLLSVGLLAQEKIDELKDYAKRVQWLREKRPSLFEHIADLRTPGKDHLRLFSLLSKERLEKLLSKMLDETELLSPFGIRSLSQIHQERPYEISHDPYYFKVAYEPAETTSRIFGGNSNWRGPVWLPINYLLIEALASYDRYYGDSFQIECPKGSGKMLTLKQVSGELIRRIASLFLPDANGQRPLYGPIEKFQTDPLFRDYLLFYEYFNGDTGQGLGASHQTGWTSLIAPLLGKK